MHIGQHCHSAHVAVDRFPLVHLRKGPPQPSVQGYKVASELTQLLDCVLEGRGQEGSRGREEGRRGGGSGRGGRGREEKRREEKGRGGEERGEDEREGEGRGGKETVLMI